MRIKHVEIENFRLLRHVAIGLEERTTLIVGRNNSGKTSIAELFRRLLSERALSFKLEDFSLGCHECFWTAFDAFRGGAAQSDVLAHLPSITITLDIAYDVDAPDLGPLSDCIRSEEHTSELQSLMRISYAVFCLKKKNHKKNEKTVQNNRISTN